MVCSLWLMPVASDAARLSALVEHFSQAFRGPPVAPHLTLTSPLSSNAPSETFVVEPTTARFSRLGFGSDRHRGCYLEPDDPAELRALQDRAAAAVGGAVLRTHPPHVSLAYIVLDAPQRARARALFADCLDVTFDRVELWSTDGPEPTWHRIR